MITQQELKDVLDYDPESGGMTWRLSRSNRVKVGDRAGTNSGHGYLVVRVLGEKHYVHRLAWLYSFGVFPVEHIDHVNGDRSDNRISNLREASQSENFQNLKSAKITNKCGMLGAHKHKQVDNKWQARIRLNYKTYYLGLFDSAEQAHEAYLKAKREIHPFGTL